MSGPELKLKKITARLSLFTRGDDDGDEREHSTNGGGEKVNIHFISLLLEIQMDHNI